MMISANFAVCLSFHSANMMRSMARLLHWCVILAAIGLEAEALYKTHFYPNVRIPCRDGVALQAQLILPIPRHRSERFEVLIYPNSWDFDKWEYIMDQVTIANHGYITVGYSARYAPVAWAIHAEGAGCRHV